MRRAWTALASAAILMLVTPQARADPLFRVGEGGLSWTDAMQSGRVLAATGMVEAEGLFYGGTGLTYEYSTPTLVPDVMSSDGRTSHTALQMSWADAPPQTDLSVAAWRYAYGSDPDLTGTRIDFSLLPPANVMGVSLTLIDNSNRTRGWFLGPIQGGLPPVWGEFSIDPALAAVQGPFTACVSNPLFDLTNVVGIQLDEAGRVVVLPVPPPPIPVPGAPLWNTWNHLEVVPEPSALVAMGIGALITIGWAIRRRPC